MAKKQQKYQFFRHQLYAMTDEKIMDLRCEEGMEGYGIYWGLLEMLGQANDYRLTCKYKLLAYQMNTNPDKVQRVVENYGLFIVENGMFYLREVYIFSKRIECWKNNIRQNGRGNGMVNYAWYVFQKGYKGQPTLFWL